MKKPLQNLLGTAIIALILTLCGCAKKQTSVAGVTTEPPGVLGSTTATLGGEVISDGGLPVLLRGVCWSTAHMPTTTDHCDTAGTSATGNYTVAISGLSSNTTYYSRAWVVNAAGMAYSGEISFTTQRSQTDMLTAAPWKYKNYTQGGRDLLHDYPCMADDQLIFSRNFGYQIIDAGLTCGSGGYTGTWSFNANETRLNLSLGGKTYLAALTDSSLLLVDVNPSDSTDIDLGH